MPKDRIPIRRLVIKVLNSFLIQTSNMAHNVIVFHCSSCDCKLQVPRQMAGVTGPCPDCGASITAPGTSTKTPENDPGTAPIKKKPSTNQELSLAPQIDHQDDAAVGIQAEGPDEKKIHNSGEPIPNNSPAAQAKTKLGTLADYFVASLFPRNCMHRHSNHLATRGPC